MSDTTGHAGRVFAVLHHPPGFSARSGLFPLVHALGAIEVEYEALHERVGRRSWTLGHWLRSWGNRHYGSTWNSLVPWLDEPRLADRIPARSGDIVHFLWGEFASPRRPRLFARRGARLVGTFHCSARRQPSVLKGFRCFDSFDRITVMSRTQIPFLLEQGVPADRIDITLHGVDTSFFTPPASPGGDGGTMRLLLCGSTERDHETAAAVMRRLRGEAVRLDVLTSKVCHAAYAGLDNVRLLPFLDDEALRDAYRHANAFFIPLLDCTANNAVLEAMACGLPVLVNKVGGIPEYVSPGAGMILENPSIDDWVGAVLRARDGQQRSVWSEAARRRAVELDWRRVAQQFRAAYDRVTGAP